MPVFRADGIGGIDAGGDVAGAGNSGIPLIVVADEVVGIIGVVFGIDGYDAFVGVAVGKSDGAILGGESGRPFPAGDIDEPLISVGIDN